jgi:hypothetical protein
LKRSNKNIILGRLDYYRFPELRNSWNGPFNGQEKRQKLFDDLVRLINFEAVAETGTYRGNTSEFFFHKTGSPVYTVEHHSRFYGFSRMRFFMNSKIRIFLMDSRDFLIKLSQDKDLKKKKVFFYLDAHWSDDLPLAEEVELIFKHWEKAVVMIDDFEVPFDKGYTFDNYGDDKILNLNYLKTKNNHRYKIFFPSIPSAKETGEKRGCVILSQDATLNSMIIKSDYITEWKE